MTEKFLNMHSFKHNYIHFNIHKQRLLTMPQTRKKLIIAGCLDDKSNYSKLNDKLTKYYSPYSWMWSGKWA